MKHAPLFSFRRKKSRSALPLRWPLFTLGAVALTGVSPRGASAAPTAKARPVAASTPKTARNWWPQTMEPILVRSGENRPQLVLALQQVPVAQREGLLFLLQNMPDSDVKSLSAPFLLRHIALAYGALANSPWKAQIPHSIFLNDVLPYASLNEVRDDSLQVMQSKAAPLIIGCKTPAEAAMRLNAQLFPLVNVRYSTERKKADQSAIESMASGKATCSGLSILLVSACRAVGVPARVVGTPMWANGRGNHTWVEIWDGSWKFLGAAEPDEKGLDHGWFVGDAAQARADVPENSIYASSFQKTGVHFPLVWAPEIHWVNAVNVTPRYAPTPVAAAPGTSRVLVKLVDEAGKRVAAPVKVLDAAGAVVASGTTRGESADLNNILPFDLPRGGQYKVVFEAGGQPVSREFASADGAEQIVTVSLAGAAPLWMMQPTYVSPPVTAPLSPAVAAEFKKALTAYFGASPMQQKEWKWAPQWEKLLQDNEPAARRAAWEAFREAPLHSAMKADFEAKQVHNGPYLSPYLLKTVGERPAKGWGLVIAMHGGGNAPQELNDSQWRGMFTHYKDHPEAGGYYYLALRAPNNTWNGFYDDYVYPLIGNLIEQFALFGDIDQNKVFIMGYSHGGYGAYAIGPKMPDHFAAIHASAGAATDGETTAKTLRNVQFTAMVGGKDTDYGRLERNQKFAAELKELRGNRSDIYPARVDVVPGVEHSYLRDFDKLTEMLPATRNPVPRDLTWLMTDGVIHDFYWLRTDSPAKKREIDATCQNNRIQITTTDSGDATVLLDSRLVDFSKPIDFNFNGQKLSLKLKPSLSTLCETLQERGDPDLAFTAKIKMSQKM